MLKLLLEFTIRNTDFQHAYVCPYFHTLPHASDSAANYVLPAVFGDSHNFMILLFEGHPCLIISRV